MMIMERISMMMIIMMRMSMMVLMERMSMMMISMHEAGLLNWSLGLRWTTCPTQSEQRSKISKKVKKKLAF